MQKYTFLTPALFRPWSRQNAIYILYFISYLDCLIFSGGYMENIYLFFHIYLLNCRQLSESLRRVDPTPHNFNWSSLSHHHPPPSPLPPHWGV